MILCTRHISCKRVNIYLSKYWISYLHYMYLKSRYSYPRYVSDILTEVLHPSGWIAKIERNIMTRLLRRDLSDARNKLTNVTELMWFFLHYMPVHVQIIKHSKMEQEVVDKSPCAAPHRESKDPTTMAQCQRIMVYFLLPCFFVWSCKAVTEDCQRWERLKMKQCHTKIKIVWFCNTT